MTRAYDPTPAGTPFMGPGKRWSWRFLIFSTHWALQGEKRELFCLLTQKSFTESHFCQFSFMGRASRARVYVLDGKIQGRSGR